MASDSPPDQAWQPPDVARNTSLRSFHVVDCGYYGNDKDALSQEELIVKVEGRAISVPCGVTLLLHHVQKAVQAELGSLDQSYDIYDMNGSRVRTDQDLREAVMAGRTPLSAQVPQLPQESVPVRQLDDQREELAQIICQLMREQSNESDIRLGRVCKQVDVLKAEMKEQKRELSTELQALRKDVSVAVESLKVSAGLGNSGKVDLPNVGNSALTAEDLTRLEEECRQGLHRLNDRINEMLKSVTNVVSEHEDYLKRACHSATEEVMAVADRCALLDMRLVKIERNLAINVTPGLASSPGSEPRCQQLPMRGYSVASSHEAGSRSPTRSALGGARVRDSMSSIDSNSNSGCNNTSLGYPGRHYKFTDKEERRISLRGLESVAARHDSNSSKEVAIGRFAVSSLSSNRSGEVISPMAMSRVGKTSLPVPASVRVPPQQIGQQLQSAQVGKIYRTRSNSSEPIVE